MRLLLFILTFSFTVRYADGQDTPKENRFYLGINCGRILVGDIEGIVKYRYNNMAVGISGGYDFNFLDFRSHSDSTQMTGESEAQTNEVERYFWGEGIVFRLFVDLEMKVNNKSRFISLEVLYKQRNYKNYLYSKYPFNFSESANQLITGATIYYGKNKTSNKHEVLRKYVGLGIRYFKTDYTRGIDPNYPTNSLGSDYFYLPSIHLGFAVLWRSNNL